MEFKKVLSVLSAALFLFTGVSENVFCAAVMSSLNSMPVNSFFYKPELFGNFAKVTEIADYGGDTVVLNVQDFHMNPTVQKNIVSIIDVLVKKYGVEKVFVEGAYGKVSPAWLLQIKNENIKKRLIEDLLNAGELSASEYYGAVNGKTDFIYGLEDEKIHKSNMLRLAGIIELKNYYGGALALMLNDLEFLQAKYFNVRNKRFANFIKRRKDGKIEAAKYYKILFKYLADNSSRTILPSDFKDYPNIVLFLQAQSLQKSLSPAALSRDLERIIQKVKEDLPFSFMPKNEQLAQQDKIFNYLKDLPPDFQSKYFTNALK
ncbi:MAG: hypothetical protein LBU09_04460, partial [Endomicrobium sp.]|nr:hypothetical protein [Endomicrobium sp.]